MPTIDDNLTVKARIQQFDLMNGDDGIRIEEWNAILFSNGAMRDINPFGQLIDPPKDWSPRSKLILKYHKTRLDWAIADFDQLKQSLALADKRFEPDFNGLNDLKKLQGIVQERRAALEAAQKELEKTKPADLQRTEEIRAEIVAKHQEYSAQLKAIEI